jgi:hypothetical protein
MVPARRSGVVGQPRPRRSWSSGEPPDYLLQQRGRSSPSTSQPSPRPPVQAPAPASSPAPAPGRGQVRRTWRPSVRTRQPARARHRDNQSWARRAPWRGSSPPMPLGWLAPWPWLPSPGLDPWSSVAPRRARRDDRPAWRRASSAARSRARLPVPAHREDGRRCRAPSPPLRFCSGEPTWVGAASSPVEPHGARGHVSLFPCVRSG